VCVSYISSSVKAHTIYLSTSSNAKPYVRATSRIRARVATSVRLYPQISPTPPLRVPQCKVCSDSVFGGGGSTLQVLSVIYPFSLVRRQHNHGAVR